MLHAARKENYDFLVRLLVELSTLAAIDQRGADYLVDNPDFVVLSHRHGDHTSGLHYVLKMNPTVKIYTPAEQQNFHTPSAPGLVNMIKRRVDSAPKDLHYFDGKVPRQIGSDSPWPDANFAQIRTPTEVLQAS